MRTKIVETLLTNAYFWGLPVIAWNTLGATNGNRTERSQKQRIKCDNPHIFKGKG